MSIIVRKSISIKPLIKFTISQVSVYSEFIFEEVEPFLKIEVLYDYQVKKP